MTAIGVIPARFASVRLPGKPLVDLCGKSMIRRVWEGVCQATQLKRIVVATDDERIAQECLSFGAEVLMTPPELPSGTDRIAHACAMLNTPFDIVVNIQGDEPLLHGRVVDQLVEALYTTNADVATPIQRIVDARDMLNPAVVKVAITAQGRALYFSRSAIPFARDNEDVATWHERHPYWKHIGLYAYRAAILQRFTALPPSPLERVEALEQLRLVEDGAAFQCVEIADRLIAVDTPEDAERVRAVLQAAQ